MEIFAIHWWSRSLRFWWGRGIWGRWGVRVGRCFRGWRGVRSWGSIGSRRRSGVGRGCRWRFRSYRSLRMKIHQGSSATSVTVHFEANLPISPSPIASLYIFVPTRENLQEKSIKYWVVTRQLYPGVDVVVDSVCWNLFIVAIKKTLGTFGEILPVSRHSVGISPFRACLSQVVVSLAQPAIEVWNCTV